MSARKKQPKIYVVWKGRKPGIYHDWTSASEQVTGFAGAQFKSFLTEAEAKAAFENGTYAAFTGVKTTGARQRSMPELADLGVVLDSIAVDAACAGVPGPLEYRGVHVETGAELFRMGPFPDGTNNLGEFLAIVHALAFLHTRNKGSMPVYSDSRTALSWLRAGRARTQHPESYTNSRIFELLRRAETWLEEHSYTNPVLKWETELWGENPADFGRKD